MRLHVGLWVALFAAPACGYRVGFDSAERYGIRTVSIRTVENRSFRQGLDVALTRQLGRDLPQFTGLVPGRPGDADARLEVEIVEVPQRSIGEAGGGSVLEGAVALAAVARLIDRSGKVLYTKRHIDWAEFRAPVGETVDSAIRESIADLSRKILAGLDGDWPGDWSRRHD